MFDSSTTFSSGAQAYVVDLEAVTTSYVFYCDDDWTVWFETNLDCDNVVPNGFIFNDTTGENEPVPATTLGEMFSTPAELQAQPLSDTVSNRGLYFGDDYDELGQYDVIGFLQSTDGSAADSFASPLNGIGFVKVYRESGAVYSIGSAGIGIFNKGSTQVLQFTVPDLVVKLADMDSDEVTQFMFVDTSESEAGPILRRGGVRASGTTDQGVLLNDVAREDVKAALSAIGSGPQIGAWLLEGGTGDYDVIAFYGSSEYLFGHTNNTYTDLDYGLQPASAEYGRYSLDAQTGDFYSYVDEDSDGDGGTGPGTLLVDGDVATYTAEGDTSSQAVTRIKSDTNPLVGAWLLPEMDEFDVSRVNSMNILVFVDDTRYMLMHTGNTEPDPELTVAIPVSNEHGTYTWNSSTGEFAAITLGESDGQGGFSNSQSPVNFTLVGDELHFVDDLGETSIVKRLMP